MIRTAPVILLGLHARLWPATTTGPAREPNQPQIRIVSEEQKQLHQLDAINLAIGLRRAIFDAGYSCKRITDAGYVGTWQNLDEMDRSLRLRERSSRDWAIFAGPDGSAQVRDCKDVVGTGLPACTIKQRPKGSFTFKK